MLVLTSTNGHRGLGLGARIRARIRAKIRGVAKLGLIHSRLPFWGGGGGGGLPTLCLE